MEVGTAAPAAVQSAMVRHGSERFNGDASSHQHAYAPTAIIWASDPAKVSRVTLLEQLATIIRALDVAGVEYALVGGLAVAVWGAPRATQDIDLLVRPESVDAVVATIEPLGFRFRALPMTFSDGMRLQRVSKIEDGALLTLDLILVDQNLEPVWASRQKVDLDGVPIWVISRAALIQMKIAAGRPQDVADIQKLEELDR